MIGLRRTIQSLFCLNLVVGCISTSTSTSTSTKDETALGKELFYDTILSADRKQSCASCHTPHLSFTNGAQFASGHKGALTDRNVPTLINRDGTKNQAWDMRAHSLEEQTRNVLTTPAEMGFSDMNDVVAQLNSDDRYRTRFQKVYGRPADSENITRALASYVRTIHSGESPYDRFLKGDESALSAEAKRGLDAFKRFRCDACHSGPNFSDEQKRLRCYPATNNLTDFMPQTTEESKKFKTPTLRNLVYTAPYMHNGSLKTLEEVVEFYTPSFQVGADGLIDKSREIVAITEQEKRDLVAFLKSLSAPEPFVESH